MIEIENENCTIIIVRPTTGGPKRRQLVAVHFNCVEDDGAHVAGVPHRAIRIEKSPYRLERG
jgi:hypothetical protein